MIRQAHELDIPRLAQLAELYSQEADYHGSMTYDPIYAIASVAMSFMHPDHCFLVSIKDGDIVGFIWGLVTPLPWSPEKIAIDNVLYTLPEVRGSSHGVRLIQAYESWAKERGAKQVSLSIASGITEESTCSVYKRLGYHPVGRQFRKEI